MTKIYESNDGGKTYSVRESNLNEIKKETMKQTAVEFLQEINEQVYLNDNDFKKAIEMEIQQMQNACSKVYDEIKMIEISDEEIEKRAKDFMYNDMIISVSSFISGAKWYREQLKKKQ